MNELQNIISDLTEIINYIKGRFLLHREFLSFANEENEDETDILYYTEVRWLSAGKMADRFFKLIPKLIGFLEYKKNLLEPEKTLKQKSKIEIDNKLAKLKDQVWLIKLAFLCDMTRHLNALNFSLQGRNNVLHESVSKLMAFSRKLQLFKQHI